MKQKRVKFQQSLKEIFALFIPRKKTLQLSRRLWMFFLLSFRICTWITQQNLLRLRQGKLFIHKIFPFSRDNNRKRYRNFFSVYIDWCSEWKKMENNCQYICPWYLFHFGYYLRFSVSIRFFSFFPHPNYSRYQYRQREWNKRINSIDKQHLSRSTLCVHIASFTF